MRPLLLFSPIFSFTAERFVEQLLEVDPSEDQEYWINSPGGSVFAGHSMLGALNERTGKNNAKVFGSADSMIAFMLLFMDNVEALDVSTFRMHRADGFVNNDNDKDLLAKINKDMRSKMELKINSSIFKEVTGHSFDEMFDQSKRIDIDLSAKDAKKIGLINKIIRLEPKQITAINENFVAFADFGNEVVAESQGSEAKSKTEIKVKQVKEIKMTKQELQEKHPEIYNAIRSEELERVEAILMFSDIDLEACKTAISGGNNPGPKFFAEMQVKAISKNELKAEAEESTTEIQTGKEIVAKSDNDIEAINFENEARAAAGLKPLEA